MNKKILTILLASALILPFASYSAQAQESTISVDYTLNSDMAPDTAKIKFYVENSGTNLADIKQKNDKTVNDAVGAIKKKLNANESVKTVAFRVNNVYSYKDKVRIFQKYEVTNGFEVKLKDLNKISEIIKIAMDNGVKRVDSPIFSIENGEGACSDLMASAVKSAKQRAQVVANAAGSDILKVKSINPYCSLSSTVAQPRYYANSSLKAAYSATDEAAGAMDVIEPGTINIRAGVNLTYYLK